jgi:hypothetical protein
MPDAYVVAAMQEATVNDATLHSVAVPVFCREASHDLQRPVAAAVVDVDELVGLAESLQRCTASAVEVQETGLFILGPTGPA